MTEIIDCTPDFTRHREKGLTVERAISIGLLPVSRQQLLDQNEYGLNLPPIIATIEGEK